MMGSKVKTMLAKEQCGDQTKIYKYKKMTINGNFYIYPIEFSSFFCIAYIFLVGEKK